MSLRLQIFIGIVIVVMLIFIINMVRQKKIDLRYALGWICLAIIGLLLDIFPWFVGWLARVMGIELASNMIFFVVILLLLIIIYALTVSVSRLSVKVKRLTQEIALLREEMERLEK